MDEGFTLARDASALTGMTAAAFPNLPGLLRFPAEDDGKSLAEAARRDLESTLQLLAERAQYVMGASGAAIALRDGDGMICRASAGPSAPPLETQLQVDSGLTAESIRKRQILRCDDAESDRRVDQASCRALGVKSVMVTPLLRQREPIGVFELLAERSYAFEERDVAVLERLSAMVLTALEHADAVEQAASEIAARTTENEEVEEPHCATEDVPLTSEETFLKPAVGVDLVQEVGQIHKCSACGFPVSASRDVCLDCEKARRSETGASAAENSTLPVFLSEYATLPEHGWMASAFYVVAIMLTALAIVWLVFKLH